MDRRATLMMLAAGVACAEERGGAGEGGNALDGVWSVHTTPGPGSPGASESDTLLFYTKGLVFEDNGAIDNRSGQPQGSGVQFGFYRFVRPGVFASTTWKIIAGPFGPALVKLQVIMQLLSDKEYKGEIAGEVLNFQGESENIRFTLYTHGKLLGRCTAAA